ncbi:TetR/AcrR family transcriptional regulator [Mycobacterium sp. TNTM28]|uniref:TetR/AcrR family transcriptional regulator n=2 Tax=[Mycobacterium] fortunisiensis TaxID=2600579 RepID=A0ABS6KJM5_9MYCO|nr:TetR/AcrR family transcriptional regulator [[Mycobacterium] fortunisiensis]
MSEVTTARSGPGRPAGTDSVDTRQRVLDAACRCFAQHGYGPATNNLIAEMAGVTAGSLHYHFGSKSKLFEAVCDYVYGKIVARSVEALAGPHSVRGLLRAVLAESMRINHESPELAGFVATAPIDARRHTELSEAFTKQAEAMTTTLSKAVSSGQRAGLIPQELDPVAVAGMISAIVDGFAHAAANTDVAVMDSMNQLFGRLLLEPDGAP